MMAVAVASALREVRGSGVRVGRLRQGTGGPREALQRANAAYAPDRRCEPKPARCRLTTLLGHGGTPSPLPLSRAAQPFADHLRASRDPSVGGSRANPPDRRCATWDQARANESWRARPRPDGPPAHGSPP